MKTYYIALLLLLFTQCGAVDDINDTNSTEDTYIDRLHTIISDKIVDYFNDIDVSLSNMLRDENSTSLDIHSVESADAFFRNDKFIEDTEETFVSVNMGSNFNSNGTNALGLSVNARLPLTQSTKEYNLFINDLNQDNVNNIIKNSPLQDQSRMAIGVNYFAPAFKEIKSKYSIGTNGINPFSIARYRIVKNFNTWKIEPAQVFKYSAKDSFEENTHIYLDKQLTEFKLFRIDLFRASQFDSGMDYGLALTHYWILKNNAGLSLSQSFSGNTQYEYSTNNPLIPQETKKDGGITNYTTSLSYRRSVWRKWFFYGLTPNVNFQKQNNYEANYGIGFFLDLYFGNIK